MTGDSKSDSEHTAAVVDVNKFAGVLGPFVVAEQKTRMVIVFTDKDTENTVNDWYGGLSGLTGNDRRTGDSSPFATRGV